MKIKDLTLDSRPREKLVEKGVENLSNPELLALVFGIGRKGENAVEMSNRLINEYGLDKLSECSLKELQKIKGIGLAKACQLKALFEFNKRYNLAKNPIKRITCAKDVFDLFHEKLKDEKQENFIVLLLSNKNHVLGDFLVAKGVLDSAIIHPREIFKPAIKNSASRIILIHNHPSGDPTPSEEDLDITEKLIEAGKLIDINVLDHVIIGEGRWWGWREKRS